MKKKHRKICKKILLARCIIYILIGIIALLLFNNYIEKIKIKDNYISYYVRGYCRACSDRGVLEKFKLEHPDVDLRLIYFYISSQVIKDIKKEIYEGIEASIKVKLNDNQQ